MYSNYKKHGYLQRHLINIVSLTTKLVDIGSLALARINPSLMIIINLKLNLAPHSYINNY